MSDLETYSVKVIDRLSEIINMDEISDQDSVAVIYTFTEGYENLQFFRDGALVSEFAGAYHPNSVCEGGGVCRWCGKTL